MKYSATTRGFYPEDLLNEYKNLPDDLVSLTEEEHRALLKGQEEGDEIVPGEGGKPVRQKPQPPTPEQKRSTVDKNRRYAYAHAQTGSDRLFAEAQRMNLMGEPGWEAKRDAAVARYNEIQASLPWPEEA